ncbi:MAG: hydrogenase iron-sulfur subunit [Chloroflexota bacterium]
MSETKDPSKKSHLWDAVNPSVDWDKRQNTVVRKFLNVLEKITLALESPVNVFVRDSRFNPLYHTGTISVTLLMIVLFTGLYLTMFYQFGFDASYQAIANLESNYFNRWMRAVHRYASDAAMITTLLHGWRTLFQDRFRGARWLAWVSGVVITVMLWAIGVTGYWMLWDQQAQVITQSFVVMIKNSTAGISFLLNFLVGEDAGTGWIFMLILFVIHLLLSLILGLGFWYFHVKRLNRPKILPPSFWTWSITGIILLFSLIIPVELQPQYSPEQLPQNISIDPFYLLYLPAALKLSPAVFWWSIAAIIGIITAIPWLLARKSIAPIQVNTGRCTGCTLCEQDCPYTAIKMQSIGGQKHQKLIAEINPDLCVACGICIGSCPVFALALGEMPPEPLWQETISRASQSIKHPQKVVFTCERHAQHNQNGNEDIQIVPLTCVGMLHPNLIEQTLEAGAAEVQVIGCPPEDCSNREGNLWLQQRIDRQRKPKLNQKLTNAPISTDWVAPNNFTRAINASSRQAGATAYHPPISKKKWRTFLPAIILVGLITALQIWVSEQQISIAQNSQAGIELSLVHHSGYPLVNIENNLEPEPGLTLPTTLVIEVDGEIIFAKEYPLLEKNQTKIVEVFEQVPIPNGKHHLKLSLYDRPNQIEPQVLFEKTLNLESGQVLAFNFRDEQIFGDPDAGEKLFYETSLGVNAGCRICHSLQPDVVLVGPSFAGVATRAAERIPGMSAEAYLHQSIHEPDAYVVDGFTNVQTMNFGDQLNEDQIKDLIAFLMTLEE